MVNTIEVMIFQITEYSTLHLRSYVITNFLKCQIVLLPGFNMISLPDSGCGMSSDCLLLQNTKYKIQDRERRKVTTSQYNNNKKTLSTAAGNLVCELL